MKRGGYRESVVRNRGRISASGGLRQRQFTGYWLLATGYLGCNLLPSFEPRPFVGWPHRSAGIGLG